MNIEPVSSKKTNHKEGSIGSSMIFCQNQETNNIYKSFIHEKFNNNDSDNKKSGGLEFLMKFKKEQ